MPEDDGWAPGKQFEAAEINPKLLDAWEAIARAESHCVRLGDWNFPMIVRSLIVALREGKEKAGECSPAFPL